MKFDREMRMKNFSIDQSKFIGPGIYLANNCEICGMRKQDPKHNREKCSKIKQKKFKS